MSLQLPPSLGSVSCQLHHTFAARTRPGRRSEKNEDAYVLIPSLGLFGVADGMGGAPAGNVASAIAAAAVVDVVSDARGTQAPADALLAKAVQEANRRVLAAARRDATMKGMGTTLTMALARGTRVVLAHVGDSRAYLLHGRRLDRVTDDHVLQNDPRWAAMGHEERATWEKYRLALTRAVGTREAVDVDVRVLAPQDGDILLLCTDGLTMALTDGEIRAVLLEHADVAAAAGHLAALAQDACAPDDVTVVAVRWAAREGR